MFYHFFKKSFETYAKAEAATGGILQKKLFLKISQNSQKNTCSRVSFLIKLKALACYFLKKDTLTLVFSCEFYEIFKNTFFTEHLQWLLL